MKNLPIALKIVFATVLLGFVSLGITVASSERLMQVDNAYQQLIGEHEAAALWLARANRSFQMMRAGLGDLLISSTDETNRLADREVVDARASFTASIDEALKASANPKISSIKADALSNFDHACGPAYAAAKTATAAADVAASQALYLKDCQPLFADLVARFVAVTNEETSLAQSNIAKIESDNYNAIIWLGIASLSAAFGMSFLVYVFSIKWLVNPIKHLVATMLSLSKGDLSTAVTATERRDEIGLMARTVQVFKDNALEAQRVEAQASSDRLSAETERASVARRDAQRTADMTEATEGLANALARMATGDLSVELPRNFASEFEPLRLNFNSSVSQLRATFEEFSGSIGTIDGGARELSQSAMDLSKRTENQAASLEETAAALDQVTVNVAHAAQRAQEATARANEANQSARHSGDVVQRAVDAMRTIEKSSQDIANIIGVIDEIAFQTNLLALNAGVEAARAGEQGKGFAVVAQEVRELAQRSAHAAKEIKTLIQGSSREVSQGVQLVTDTGKALSQIQTIVADVTEQLTAIALASKEQSAGLGQVNIAVNQMDQATQQNAAMVEEATAASAALASEADRLRTLVNQFKLSRNEKSRTLPVEEANVIALDNTSRLLRSY